MRKEQLLEAIASRSSLSQQAVNKVLKSLHETVIDALKRGERVVVSGLGVFDVGNRAKRRARNPQTKKLIEIPAMKIPQFRASIGLKKATRE